MSIKFAGLLYGLIQIVHNIYPFEPKFTIVIFIHYKPWIAVAILDFIHYKPWIAVTILDL